MEMTIKEFTQQKKQILQGKDLSKKGCIDEGVKEIVHLINSKPEYVTTSSCSGRTILFCEDSSGINKKGCKWLYTTHEEVNESEFLLQVDATKGDLVLKYEPLIVHIQCLSVEHGKSVHTCAINSGFRNSGITVGKHGKVVLAVRACIGMEVPLSENGKLLVSSQYLQFLSQKANKKMEENKIRTQRLYENLKTMFCH